VCYESFADDHVDILISYDGTKDQASGQVWYIAPLDAPVCRTVAELCVALGDPSRDPSRYTLYQTGKGDNITALRRDETLTQYKARSDIPGCMDQVFLLTKLARDPILEPHQGRLMGIMRDIVQRGGPITADDITLLREAMPPLGSH